MNEITYTHPFGRLSLLHQENILDRVLTEAEIHPHSKHGRLARAAMNDDHVFKQFLGLVNYEIPLGLYRAEHQTRDTLIRDCNLLYPFVQAFYQKLIELEETRI